MPVSHANCNGASIVTLSDPADLTNSSPFLTLLQILLSVIIVPFAESLKPVGGLEVVEEDNAVSAPNPNRITLECCPCWHSLFDVPPPNYDLLTVIRFADILVAHWWFVHISRLPLEGRRVGSPVSPAAFIDHIPAAVIVGAYSSDESIDIHSVYPSSPAILWGLMYTTYVQDNPPVTDRDRNMLVEATKMWAWCLVVFSPEVLTDKQDFAVG
ncbi:hypothetical protein B0H10DRAFT_1960323 [Mycena sp. CBHHK59/15]|nr:hypothetical protein B0H10DRAFT_1960323 [Mycena sp. CBHHK59/15]